MLKILADEIVPVPGPNKESVSAQRKYRCPKKQTITRGVSHCGLAIYIKKYPNAKKEL
jgi:hypothetical protein